MTQVKKSAADRTERNGGTPTREKQAEREATGNGAVATFDAWSRASHVAMVGLFVLALLWAAFVAQPVLVPVLLAWAIATIVLPFVKRLEKSGFPRVLAAVAVTLLLAALIVSLLALLSTPVAYWLGRATEVGALIKEKLQMMNQPLALLGELQKALNAVGSGGGAPTLKVEQSATVLTTIFSVLTPAVSQFVLFIGALLFYLTYQQRLRSAVLQLLRDREARLATLRTLSDIDEHMTTYFGTFTVVNLCLGIVTAVLTWIAGLPNPLLWGVLAAVFNYIPYIGPAIVTGTLAVVGLLTYPTLGEAAVAPLAFVAIVTIEGQFLTPTLMGRRLELNPFAVFLAIAFCTWLWGAVGAFLAVPLLMALTVAFGHAFAQDGPDLPE